MSFQRILNLEILHTPEHKLRQIIYLTFSLSLFTRNYNVDGLSI